MLNTVYRLVAPRRFEIEFSDLNLNEGVLVRPTYMSICHADQRYYQGTRPMEVMKQKLPMALIHESTGRVVYDPDHRFAPGEAVVMIPNTPTEKDRYIEENYLRSSRFRGSGYDGFMQENVQMNRDRIIPVPKGLPGDVAAFTELVSVSRHAISRFEKHAFTPLDRIAVWGDGNLGYITALLIRSLLPDCHITVCGKHDEKLAAFSWADETLNVADIPENMAFDHAFECVGGTGSQSAISQIIDHINPEGVIALMGVSENPPGVNTRMVLEKGLTLLGSSRSGRQDFLDTFQVYRDDPEVVGYLQNLAGNVTAIRSVADMNQAFETDMQKSIGKTIMKWEV